jgi:hypothetical protein
MRVIGGGTGIWPACVPERDTIQTKFPFRKLCKSFTPDTANMSLSSDSFPCVDLGKEMSESQEVKKEGLAKRESMCYIEHIM